MKNSNLKLVSIFLAFLPTIAVCIIDPNFNKIDFLAKFSAYFGAITYFLVNLLFMSISEKELDKKIFEKLNLVNAIFVIIIGFLSIYFTYFNTSDSNQARLIFTCIALFLAIRANYQPMVPQKSFMAVIMREYSEKTYKKSQRITSRFMFYSGLIGAFIFLISPAKYFPTTLFSFFIVFYVGSFVMLYMNLKSIDE